MMKKILVIGIKGMAGHVIFQYLKETSEHQIFGIARNIKNSPNVFNLDVSNTKELEKLIKENHFDTIINCIGILNKDAEDNPSKAIWFNSYFPHFLEKITQNTDTQIIHISTDCVFSGSRGGYTEKDIKDGVGFYAQSKALGELENDKDLTIRTSIIGPEINSNGIGLFHWFMSQSTASELNGYSEVYWSGITTVELAKLISYFIEKYYTGLIQVAPKQKIDKHSLLSMFNKIFRDNKMIILPNSEYIVDKSLVSIRKDFQYNVPQYEEMLLEMKKWIIDHKNFYTYIFQ